MEKTDRKIDLSRYYHLRSAAAYTRGKLNGHELPGALIKKPLADLSIKECARLYQYGLDGGLRLHRFKRSAALPRVQKTLGILKTLQPANLLDIGTGRGVFLWPLLDTFACLQVTCIDLLDYRTADINAVARGGFDNLFTMPMDAAHLAFRDRIFDGVTLLETLEHAPQQQQVINEVCRVSNRFIILSVPSKADNNPGHLHLFTTDKLRSLFTKAGDFNIKFDSVLNHIVALALRQ